MAPPEDELNEHVKSRWKTESFGCKYDSKQRRSKEDKVALDSLSKATRRVDGRFEVILIWKDSIATLPNNRVAGGKRLGHRERSAERAHQEVGK